jgi:hypothetical protein
MAQRQALLKNKGRNYCEKQTPAMPGQSGRPQFLDIY